MSYRCIHFQLYSFPAEMGEEELKGLPRREEDAPREKSRSLVPKLLWKHTEEGFCPSSFFVFCTDLMSLSVISVPQRSAWNGTSLVFLSSAALLTFRPACS